ncbi:MAG: glycosyltransferase [Chloroflexota bacterium]
MKKKPRILLYSHDTFGLGHLRRSLSIAWQIARDIPQAHQLLITGSMVAGAFDLPPRLDLIKLPALSKRSSGKYKARVLPMSLKQTLTWREQMILQAVMNFQPDLVLVDKVAAGVQGELLPALRYLKACAPQTQIVLGMRDIEDSPEKTRAEWAANETPQLQDYLYDALFLYGERTVFDPVTAYGMSQLAERKLVSCGYLRRVEVGRSAEAVRRELNIGHEPLVVVTVGGGGDGHAILKTYLEMLATAVSTPNFHTLLVTGPLMAEGKRQSLRKMAANLPVTFMEFTSDLGSYLSAADLVISMAGYNTVCELLSLGKRTLLIPRVQTRAEQLIRAMMLAERGLAHLLLPSELTPERLRQAMEATLAAPPPQNQLNMNGLTTVSTAVRDLLENEKTTFTQPDYLLEEVLV